MNSNRLVSALNRNNDSCPPVWLMRQAGRYHAHYQKLRKEHSFMDLCKQPALACEVTLGPVEDFDFDAAILFSDLLFPLEAMGMGLKYEGRPTLDWYIRTPADLKKLSKPHVSQLAFQGEALQLIRAALPRTKGLLGFVGGPLTLFFYAVEGSHQGDLISAHQGMLDGRFEGFCDRLCELLVENMVLQAQAGVDAIAVMDTCAGEVSSEVYQASVIPRLKEVLRRYKLRTDVPILYYSKGTTPEYWASLTDLPIVAKGIDWNFPIGDVLKDWSPYWSIQGNVDPRWLLLPEAELRVRLCEYFTRVKNLPAEIRRGWICGLGHGVLPPTPESNVRLLVQLQREYFG